MATQPKLVNKQFNSPIGLYSEQNIREVIERESQLLANGAVGINFNNPAVGKPSNLQNSAVLRMLEEEEMRQRNGHSPGNGYDYSRPLRDQIKWPPPDYENKNILKATFKDVVTPGLKRVAWPPPHEGELFLQSPTQPQPPQGGPQYTPQPQNNYASAPQAAVNSSSRSPLRPLDISTASSLSSASPIANQSPSGFRPATPSKQWAPVTSPLAHPHDQPQYQPQYQNQNQYQAPGQQYQTPSQQYQAPGQQYQTPSQQYQAPGQQYQTPSQQYQAPGQGYQAPSQQYQPSGQQYQTPSQQYPQGYPSGPQSQYSQQPSTQYAGAPSQVAQQARPAARPVEPPPSTITLRKEAPVRQAPPPVVTSQPATATLKGGKHLRGDLKWPPEHVRQRFAADAQFQQDLAKGPACRPTLKRKDYTPFFAQHALNSSYPGYKIPPGTQFYEHEPRF